MNILPAKLVLSSAWSNKFGGPTANINSGVNLYDTTILVASTANIMVAIRDMIK